MNNQEREQLSQFLNQLTSTQLPQKDQEADSLIRDAAGRQPDALYLLTQRAMLLEQALNNSKTQIAELQNQLSRSNPNSGFLPNDPWAQPQPTMGQGVPGAGQYQTPRYQAPPVAAAAAVGGAPSFLTNVATTAAGVVAGSFLFQGIENLMGHHSSPWGGGHDGLTSGLHDQPDNMTINNYYGDDAQASQHQDYADQNQTDVHQADYQPDDDFDNSGDDSGWI